MTSRRLLFVTGTRADFGKLEPLALADYCKGQIASYKIPRYVRFMTEWPMSTTKVRKPDLAKLPLGDRLI